MERNRYMDHDISHRSISNYSTSVSSPETNLGSEQSQFHTELFDPPEVIYESLFVLASSAENSWSLFRELPCCLLIFMLHKISEHALPRRTLILRLLACHHDIAA